MKEDTKIKTDKLVYYMFYYIYYQLNLILKP